VAARADGGRAVCAVQLCLGELRFGGARVWVWVWVYVCVHVACVLSSSQRRFASAVGRLVGGGGGGGGCRSDVAFGSARGVSTTISTCVGS